MLGQRCQELNIVAEGQAEQWGDAMMLRSPWACHFDRAVCCHVGVESMFSETGVRMTSREYFVLHCFVARAEQLHLSRIHTKALRRIPALVASSAPWKIVAARQVQTTVQTSEKENSGEGRGGRTRAEKQKTKSGDGSCRQ